LDVWHQYKRIKEIVENFWKTYKVNGTKIYKVKEKMKMLKKRSLKDEIK